MQISCPTCGKGLNVDASAAGQQARCPSCQQAFVVPTPATPQPVMAASAAPAYAAPTYAAPPAKPAASQCAVDGCATLRMVARILIVVGLFVVVFARGLDSTGARSVMKADAKANEAASREYESGPRAMGADNSSRQKEIEDLRKAAREARADNVSGGVFREWFFVIGSLLFVLGLMGGAFFGVGGEKIVSFILAAIVVLSIYVGGIAWLPAVMGMFK